MLTLYLPKCSASAAVCQIPYLGHSRLLQGAVTGPLRLDLPIPSGVSPPAATGQLALPHPAPLFIRTPSLMSTGSSSSPPCTFAAMTRSSRQCRTCDAPATATPVLRITPGRVRRTFGCIPSSHIVKDSIHRLVFFSAMHLCRDDALVAAMPNVRRTRHCHSRTSHHAWAGASHVRAHPVKPHRQGRHPPARLLLRHALLPR